MSGFIPHSRVHEQDIEIAHVRCITRLHPKLFVVALLDLPAAASAETYCVSTAVQWTSIIESADASASASEIRVRTGSHTLAVAPAAYALHINGTSEL